MSVLDAKLRPTQETTHIQRFQIKVKTDHAHLLFHDDVEFGYLRPHMTKGLDKLLASTSFYLEAVGETDVLRETIGRAAKPSEALVRVGIIIYGPPSEANDIGSHLSEHKLWLQTPDYPRRDVDYKNPHVLEFGGLGLSDIDKPKDLTQRAAPKPRSEETHLRQTMNEVYNSTRRQEGLTQIAVSGHFKTPMLP